MLHSYRDLLIFSLPLIYLSISKCTCRVPPVFVKATLRLFVRYTRTIVSVLFAGIHRNVHIFNKQENLTCVCYGLIRDWQGIRGSRERRLQVRTVCVRCVSNGGPATMKSRTMTLTVTKRTLSPSPVRVLGIVTAVALRAQGRPAQPVPVDDACADGGGRSSANCSSSSSTLPSSSAISIPVSVSV